ncbi:LacI family DNA-binding transcriptional regulator [Olivibacter sp. SDN3]|uniref:LacI family DNA-binding transcriptional regulator n=1 Tax=Olivibacter sp. SDN3 TaxID=2764720 RepID=UPI0016513773|nr:LacI family DNA-binding transcriptional regulator [Olivibacter sp. SDN3]QNL50186.1 LacI family DNA-binding transcriptional regulator [Olivibacter sp. SDN3]
MKKVTMKQLATALNLSSATVSKALRDSYDISEATKQRVLKLAEKLNYSPNAHASSLRGKQSKTIAVVIPEVADSFFAQAINGVESIAQAAGYHVLIYLTHEKLQKERDILKELQNGRVDGVLLSVSTESVHSRHIDELQAAGMPVVLFDRIIEQTGIGQVYTNDQESCCQLTQHLISLQCKKITFLAISDAPFVSKRQKGFRKAVESQGVSGNVLYCSNDENQNRLLIHDLLTGTDKPDGIIASVEKLTTGVYLACQEMNIAIPQALKFGVFSNLNSAAILAPPLTTITQPAFEIGEAAASILLKFLKEIPFDTDERTIMIPARLDIRASTQV